MNLEISLVVTYLDGKNGSDPYKVKIMLGMQCISKDAATISLSTDGSELYR